jgi:hypothetical protein
VRFWGSVLIWVTTYLKHHAEALRLEAQSSVSYLAFLAAARCFFVGGFALQDFRLGDGKDLAGRFEEARGVGLYFHGDWSSSESFSSRPTYTINKPLGGSVSRSAPLFDDEYDDGIYCWALTWCLWKKATMDRHSGLSWLPASQTPSPVTASPLAQAPGFGRTEYPASLNTFAKDFLNFPASGAVFSVTKYTGWPDCGFVLAFKSVAKSGISLVGISRGITPYLMILLSPFCPYVAIESSLGAKITVGDGADCGLGELGTTGGSVGFASACEIGGAGGGGIGFVGAGSFFATDVPSFVSTLETYA